MENKILKEEKKEESPKMTVVINHINFGNDDISFMGFGVFKGSTDKGIELTSSNLEMKLRMKGKDFYSLLDTFLEHVITDWHEDIDKRGLCMNDDSIEDLREWLFNKMNEVVE